MENRPIGRQKKVVAGSGSVKRQGSRIDGGPVGNRNGNTGLNKNTGNSEAGFFKKLFGGNNKEER